MSDRIFVDTNILVYAHDLSGGDRHAKASAVVEGLWEAETGVISTQVLQEFYVTVTRKIKNPLKPDAAREIIRNYLAWPIQINDPEMTIRASEIEVNEEGQVKRKGDDDDVTEKEEEKPRDGRRMRQIIQQARPGGAGWCFRIVRIIQCA